MSNPTNNGSKKGMSTLAERNLIAMMSADRHTHNKNNQKNRKLQDYIIAEEDLL